MPNPDQTSPEGFQWPKRFKIGSYEPFDAAAQAEMRDRLVVDRINKDFVRRRIVNIGLIVSGPVLGVDYSVPVDESVTLVRDESMDDVIDLTERLNLEDPQPPEPTPTDHLHHQAS